MTNQKYLGGPGALLAGPQQGSLSFKDFASAPAYQELNSNFVESVLTGRVVDSVVDLGCGPGLVTQLIASHVRDGASITGVDPSRSALKMAEKNLERFENVRKSFVQGTAEDLPRLVGQPVDAIFFLNAIHQIDDKAKVIQDIAGALNPGGVFAFNSAFFHADESEEMRAFYKVWMFRALKLLAKRHGISRLKRKVASRAGLTVAEYRDLLQGAGLRAAELRVVKVDLNLEAALALSRFKDFISGTLPGVPLQVGREVLEEAVERTYESLSLRAVTRNWLLAVAERP